MIRELLRQEYVDFFKDEVNEQTQDILNKLSLYWNQANKKSKYKIFLLLALERAIKDYPKKYGDVYAKYNDNLFETKDIIDYAFSDDNLRQVAFSVSLKLHNTKSFFNQVRNEFNNLGVKNELIYHIRHDKESISQRDDRAIATNDAKSVSRLSSTILSRDIKPDDSSIYTQSQQNTSPNPTPNSQLGTADNAAKQTQGDIWRGVSSDFRRSARSDGYARQTSRDEEYAKLSGQNANREHIQAGATATDNKRDDYTISQKRWGEVSDNAKRSPTKMEYSYADNATNGSRATTGIYGNVGTSQILPRDGVGLEAVSNQGYGSHRRSDNSSADNAKLADSKQSQHDNDTIYQAVTDPGIWNDKDAALDISSVQNDSVTREFGKHNTQNSQSISRVRDEISIFTQTTEREYTGESRENFSTNEPQNDIEPIRFSDIQRDRRTLDRRSRGDNRDIGVSKQTLFDTIYTTNATTMQGESRPSSGDSASIKRDDELNSSVDIAKSGDKPRDDDGRDGTIYEKRMDTISAEHSGIYGARSGDSSDSKQRNDTKLSTSSAYTHRGDLQGLHGQELWNHSAEFGDSIELSTRATREDSNDGGKSDERAKRVYREQVVTEETYSKAVDEAIAKHISDKYLDIGSSTAISIDIKSIEIPSKKKERIQANLDALETYLSLRLAERDIRNTVEIDKFDNRIHIYANQSSLEKFAKYTGFGGLSSFFNEENTEYAQERERFEAIFANYKANIDSDYEINAINNIKNTLILSSDNAYYTPLNVIDGINKIIDQLGFSNTDEKLEILEPSAGIGRFILNNNLNANFTAYELDDLTAGMLRYITPNSKVVNNDYLASSKEAKYDLVIGNPPYGSNNLTDNFVEQALHNVKDGGFVVFVTSNNFLDNCNAKTRIAISGDNEINYLTNATSGTFSGIGNLVGALRLPPDIFKDQGVGISTDIIIFQKTPIIEIDNYKENSNNNQWSKRSEILEDMHYTWFLNDDNREFTEELKKIYNIKEENGECSIYLSQIAPIERLNEYSRRDYRGKHKLMLALKEDINKKDSKLYYKLFGNSSLDNMWADTMMATNFFNSLHLMHSIDHSIIKSSQYFQNNPDNNLTNETYEISTRYGYEIKTKYTIKDNININDEIIKFAKRLPKDIFQYKKNINSNEVIKLSNLNYNKSKFISSLPIGSFVDINNNIYKITSKNSNSYSLDVQKIELNSKEITYAKSFIAYRDALLHKMELDGDISLNDNDPIIENALKQLKEKSFSFYTKANKIERQFKLFATDPMASTMLALEKLEISPDGSINRVKSKLLTQRIKPNHSSLNDSIFDKPSDGVLNSIAQYGYINVEYLADKCNLTIEETRNELNNSDSKLFFANPEYLNGNLKVDEYLFNSKYLSGNVVSKLDLSKELVFQYPYLNKNIDSLQEVQPKPLGLEDSISINLGTNFVPEYIYKKFIQETLNLGQDSDIKIKNHNKATGSSIGFGWNLISNDYRIRQVTSTINELKIIENMMNTKNTKVVKEGKIDVEATNTCKNLEYKFKDAWEKFLNKNPELRSEIYEKYTKLYMNYKEPHYDGSILNINSQVQLRPHQQNAVLRCLMEKNTFLNHQVGAGKTMTAIATAMEGKQLGTIKGKTLIAVKPETQTAWLAEIYKTYPSAKVLSSTLIDFDQKDPSNFLRTMADFDGDIVLVTHNQFAAISIPTEAKIEILQDKIIALTDIGNFIQQAKGKKRPPKSLVALQDKYNKEIIDIMKEQLNDKTLKTKLTIDKLGIGCVVFDEFQEAKNMATFTSLQVRGIKNSQGSRLGNALLEASYVFNKEDSDVKLIMLSGTPIANAPYELYNIMRIMTPKVLQESNIQSLDSFMQIYGNIEAGFELDPSGMGFIEVVRNKGYMNLIELGNMAKTVFDNVSNEDIAKMTKEKFVPDIDYIPVIVPPTQEQLKISEDISNALESKVIGSELLKQYTLGRKNSTDPRLINPNFPDEPVTKINAVVKNLVDIYNNTNDIKGTQLVFLDYGVPQTKSYNILNNATEKLSDSDIEEQTKILAKELGYVKQKLKVQKSEDAEINIIEAYYDEISDTYYKPFVNGISVEFSELNETTGISVAELSDGTTNQKIDLYADIYKKLVDHGIKPEEIAFIHDATTPSEKQKIFDNMNQGNIRILLGTYAKMGTGVNVQQKGVAMHEVTCPWRPSDIQQAEGRFIRTGNEFFEKDKKFKIKIYRYGTERTIDSLMWQANNVKAKTAREFTQGMNASSRTLTDAFSDLELSSDMMKAQATGNPFMITYALYKKYNKSVETFIDNYHTNLFRQKMQINDLESQLKLSNAIFDKFEKIDLSNISKSNIVVINTVDINNIKDYSFKGLSINLDDKKDPNYEERSRMIEELNRQAKNECQGKEIEILRYRDFSLTLIYENNAYIYNVKSEKFNTEFEQPYEFSKKLGEKSVNALSFSQLRNSLNEFIANIEKNKEKWKINSIKTQVEIEALEKDSCEKILSKEDLEEIRTSFKADFRYIEDTFKNFKSGNTALELLKEYKPKAYAPLAKLGENSIEMLGAGIKELYKQIENMHNGKLPTEITKNDALIDVDVVTKQEISSIEAVQQKPKFSSREL